MGDVIHLPVVTKLAIPVERVTNAAAQADLKEVLILGYTQDGRFYFASSEPDGPSVLWLLEVAKKELLGIIDG